MQVSVGTDPEFMVFDSGGKLTSAITVIPGHGKTNKIPIGKNKQGASIFYDNVQLELNVKPGKTAGELIENLRPLFSEIKARIHPYTFKPQASAIFSEDQLQHPDAKVFGCDPEFDAYALEIVKPPTSTDGFRSAGGHIHLGQEEGSSPLNLPYGEDNDSSDRDWGRISVIRMMDLIVGLPGVILDKDPTSKDRRKLYGAPGSHRTKDYGAEYRSMGNFWLNTPALVNLIFNLSCRAVSSVVEGHYRNLWPNDTDLSKCKYPVKKVCQAVKNADVDLAKELVEKYVKPIIPKALYLEIVTASEDKSNNFYRSWEI